MPFPLSFFDVNIFLHLPNDRKVGNSEFGKIILHKVKITESWQTGGCPLSDKEGMKESSALLGLARLKHHQCSVETQNPIFSRSGFRRKISVAIHQAVIRKLGA